MSVDAAAEEKRLRKEAKRAAKEAAAAEAEAEAEAEAKRVRKAAKKAAKEAAAAEVEVDDEPVAKKAKTSTVADAPAAEAEAPAAEASEDLTVFVGGIPWSVDEPTFRKDFEECGPITKLNLLLNDEGKPKGIAFVTYESKVGVDAALKFDNTDYGGRTLKVNVASQGGKGKGKDGKGKDGKGKDGKGKGKKGNPEMEVFVGGLAFECTEEALNKDFGECGEIDSLRMPLNDDGQCRGIAFINFKSAEGVTAALKFDGEQYLGRYLNVRKSGDDKGKGKGKDGKDGKGKGKDGKGKKGKKGKEGGLSAEKFAAKDGAMVESTGTKQTFDSDDE